MRLRKFIRKILCSMNVRHRVVHRWKYAGTTKSVVILQAAVWGCEVRKATKDGREYFEANCYECVDCGAIIAPFEQRQRHYPLQVEADL